MVIVNFKELYVDVGFVWTEVYYDSQFNKPRFVFKHVVVVEARPGSKFHLLIAVSKECEFF